MASSVGIPPAKILVSEATQAFKLLNGVVCLYKPTGYGYQRTMKEFKLKMIADLNAMEPPARKEIVEIRRVVEGNPQEKRVPLENEKVVAQISDGDGKRVEVIQGLGYGDHPLVVGNRFLMQDLKMLGTGSTSPEASGVHLYGLNHPGRQIARKIFHSRWIRTYQVSGRLGVATQNHFHTGRIIEKATYGSLRPHMIEKYMQSIQATHQRMAFQASGVPLDSERAYELASQGLVRPEASTIPIVYSMKLTHFKPPDFTVEMKVINEEFQYLKQLIHDMALRLHSAAHCTKIHCTNVGPFGLEDALLHKHWTAEHVVNNMQLVRNRLKDFNMSVRDPWVSKYVEDDIDHDQDCVTDTSNKM